MTWTPKKQQKLEILLHYFEDCLSDIQKEREYRPEVIENFEVAWVVYERLFMYGLVNEESDKLIPLADVVAAEVRATGHIDYTHKFALYCAELVMDSGE